MLSNVFCCCNVFQLFQQLHLNGNKIWHDCTLVTSTKLRHSAPGYKNREVLDCPVDRTQDVTSESARMTQATNSFDCTLQSIDIKWRYFTICNFNCSSSSWKILSLCFFGTVRLRGCLLYTSMSKIKVGLLKCSFSYLFFVSLYCNCDMWCSVKRSLSL